MFNAIRNNIGYQNVASLMRQRGIRYETTEVIDMNVMGRVHGRVCRLNG